MNRTYASVGSILALMLVAATPRLQAQAASNPPVSTDSTGATTTTKASDDSDAIVLSPFTVSASNDTGYAAKTTLAGTRINTNLDDVASSISVVTSQFLKDTGVTNQQQLLVYTTNTEVGGTTGNFGGLGNANGFKENSALLHPDQNTRVRGLDSADNTRDYFKTDIPWDSYNVDRVDLQRGPNSILFGVGSPAGIINTQLMNAEFKNSGQVQNRIGNYGSLRDSLNVNQELIKNVLAVRVAALYDDTEYQQRPAFDKDQRLYGAIRFDPKLFGNAAQTSINLNFEHGNISANRPRDTPPVDQITPFFATSSQNPSDPSEPVINRQGYEPWQFQYVTLPQGTYTTGNNLLWTNYSPKTTWNPWMGASMARLGSADPVFWYNSNSGAAMNVQQSNIATAWAVSKTGSIDGGIDGYPFAHPVSINGYNAYTKAANLRAEAMGLADPYPGALKNYYKDKTLTDPTIFDFYNNLIDGPNKFEREGWNAFNLNVSQSFFHNRLAFDFVWDRQMYHDQQEMNMSDTPFISIDNNLTLINSPTLPAGTVNASDYPPPVANPNFGRAYIGSSGHYGNSQYFSTENNLLFTAYGELKATDFLNRSWVTDLLGKHRFTALDSSSKSTTETRDYVRYATDAQWALDNNQTANISQGFRQVDWITYLSGNLSGRTSASGAYISPITAVQSPQGQTVVQYFDSHWQPSTVPGTPTYVDPGAAWANPFYNTAAAPASTQSENPANYKGWTTTSVNILNADQGDLNQLYTDGSKTKTVINSQGFTWQGYMADGLIVPTFGYRKDKVYSYSAIAPQNSATGVASMNYAITGGANSISTGSSNTWGLVVHAPKFIRENLPWDSDISLTYDRSSNFRDETRYDFQGNSIPNSSGKTEEYGVVLSTLSGKIHLKVVSYKTTVTGADLSGDPSVSTLGSNTYWLYLAEAWGAASAVADKIGLSGNDTTGAAWYWDWANHDINTPYGAMPRDPASAAIDAHENAAADAWIKSMQPQSFYNAYGIPVNVANIQAADASGNWAQPYSSFIGGGWSPGAGPGGVQAAGAGKINGVYPVGTIDNVSKGYEFELTAQPLHNWNITFNASKTSASRTTLSSTLSSFIEATHQRLSGVAGDLRTWWAGDTSGTFRANFDNNVYSAYLFQQQQNGQSAPEVHPWAFNLVNTYNFDHSFLKGVDVGGGLRWQQGAILGYRLKADPIVGDPNNVVYDVNAPIYGSAQSAVDLWVGYQRKLTDKISWQIQLNLRNVGQKTRLTPISVEPDGTPAAQRIMEGMAWQLTNTFSF